MKKLLVLAALIGLLCSASHADFRLWQLSAHNHKIQMCGYVIQTEHGKIIMIDGGYLPDGEMVRDFVAERGGVVEAWFLTHYHNDHTGALSTILTDDKGPKINRVYIHPLDYDKVNIYENDRMIRILNDQFKEHNIFPLTLVAGTVFYIDGVKIEVLRVYNPDIHENFGNNAGSVFRISDSKRSVLFLGDLGVEGGRELLAKYGNKLKSDYVQMAHHGQNGVEKDVYEAINPKVCLWPTPKWLWDNNRGKGYNTGPWKTVEVRGWMDELGVKTHYVSMDGILEIK